MHYRFVEVEGGEDELEGVANEWRAKGYETKEYDIARFEEIRDAYLKALDRRDQAGARHDLSSSSPRDLFAGHRTDVGCIVRAYVRLWLFDRWLGQIWRHIRRHVWREFRVIGLRDRRRRHSDLLFDGATDVGLCLFHEPGGLA
ncbi:hypothetical protein [Sinorhizobium meliloti]|uniref:hypothetical protein n=1 Tax=Rhizobium meliloti TaxID=382 RepID=UPI00107198C1|nr:hypothetical protein [Sinorhizobium meliloti]MQW26797.1 hypothetical protein [Sinorhizobium meliloti]